MKIFITGADGALGTEMQNILKSEKVNFLATDINQLDITYYKKTNETITNYRPDVILHFASIADVDECERNRDLAYRVNVLGTMGLANIARKLGAKMLYVSTNFVFDGNTEDSYQEQDTPHPISEYGKTKYLGEICVKDLCDKYYIIRTAWLFGSRSKTFISRFLATKEKPKAIDVICDQIGSFTFIPDLANSIFQIIKSDNFGIYHLTNSGMGTWLDFALRAKELMRFNTEIRAVKTEELDIIAPRPRFAALASRTFEFYFDRKMRSWDVALAAYVQEIQSIEKH